VRVWTVLLVIVQRAFPLLLINFLTFMKPNVRHPVRKHKDLIHILSKINPLNNFLPYFFEIHFNIMPTSMSTTFRLASCMQLHQQDFVRSSLFQQTIQLQATSSSSSSSSSFRLTYDSPFQSQFFTECDLVLLLSTSSIFSFP